jgi:hypothetical protein
MKFSSKNLIFSIYCLFFEDLKTEIIFYIISLWFIKYVQFVRVFCAFIHNLKEIYLEIKFRLFIEAKNSK